MKQVRIKFSDEHFVRNQRLQVFREEGGELWLKGCDLQNTDWSRVVVAGPYGIEDVEEYVPDPPAPTVAEKLKGLML